MWVKFLQPYEIFNTGDVCDMMQKKAADLKEQGIITDEPREVRKAKTQDKKTPQTDEAPVSFQTQETTSKKKEYVPKNKVTN